MIDGAWREHVTEETLISMSSLNATLRNQNHDISSIGNQKGISFRWEQKTIDQGCKKLLPNGGASEV